MSRTSYILTAHIKTANGQTVPARFSDCVDYSLTDCGVLSVTRCRLQPTLSGLGLALLSWEEIYLGASNVKTESDPRT